ncbi:PucR family transcriptional regulator [Streptomyces sp. NPDC003393]
MSMYPAHSLGRVLDDFGRTLLNLVHGDVEAVPEIGGVAIFDPHDEQVFPERAIVLGVSVQAREEIERLLRLLATKRAAALVVRAPVAEAEELGRVVAETGVALLALTRGASWAQLAAMLRMLLAEGDVGEASEKTLGGMPSGDLFALANAISTLLDAPITIEDRCQRILAFSGRQDEADASRVAAILARQVPDGYVRILESRGVFRQLYRSSELVHITPATIKEGETALPRVAVAVRAGDELLGSMWAAVAEPLSPEREEAFKEAAKLVALHMLRARAGADAENRLRADLVTTALEGGAGAAEALRRLGLAQEPTLVMALALASHEDSDHAVMTAERQRLASALGVHLTAVQPRSAVALLGDVAYAIMPTGSDSAVAHERPMQVGTDFLHRVGGHEVLLGVGSVAQEPAALARSRTNADRVLRVLSHERSGRKIASIADVHVDALLLEMRDLAQAHGDELSAPIARLVAYDTKHNSQLVATLRAWLDAFGDVIEASARMFVHQNTFRYRIRRVVEVSGLDLDDPAQRFAAMLQLRLIESAGGSGALAVG